MPFVGEDLSSGRKRRWDVDDERAATTTTTAVYALYGSTEARDFYVRNQRADLSSSSSPSSMGMSSPRKMFPLASSKRARISDDVDIHIHDNFPCSSSSSSSSSSTTPPFSSSSAFPPSHRRRRSSLLRGLQVQTAAPSRFTTTTPKPTSASLLAPCHICHRRPTKKSDLDSFAECQGCRERACFVCIRECQGWNNDNDGNHQDDGWAALSEQEVLSRSFHMDDVDDDDNNNNEAQSPDEEHDQDSRKNQKGWAAAGHRAVVCSRCCIERGAEGDVACLGCYSRMEGS